MNMNHNGSTTPASSKHLTLLNTSSSPTAASSLPSPPYSPPASRSTPPTSAHARGVSPNDATKALKATRRQSSISYVSSRVDVFSRHGDPRPQPSCADYTRSGKPTHRRTPPNASAIGSIDRVALTLAEKHADLLHAIAAAESKRLELTGQLAAVEGELGELKRKWERIVNREPPHPILPSSAPTASVVDGLKEGVRLLAAGLSDLSDLSSPIPSPAPPINTEETAGVPRRHAQRVSDSSTSTSGVRQLSRSSVSSLWDEEISLSSGIGAEHSQRNATNQARDKEVSRARQEKSSVGDHAIFLILRLHLRGMPLHIIARAPVWILGEAVWNWTRLQMSLGVRPLQRWAYRLQSSMRTRRPHLCLASDRSPVTGGGWGSVVTLPNSLFSILCAFTPEHHPLPFPSSLRTPSSSITSLRSSSPSASASSSLRTPSSNTSSPLTRSTYLHTRTHSHVPAPRTNSWLEDEEEEDTVNAGRVMMPSAKRPNSLALTKRGMATSFDDDDDWNW
ncbi:hypothetical protein EDB19DRAFT_1770461 [Suillus lakei]|nr:hypothetical protein EDB19DRAFT_1770461 [Suillus lakei]